MIMAQTEHGITIVPDRHGRDNVHSGTVVDDLRALSLQTKKPQVEAREDIERLFEGELTKDPNCDFLLISHKGLKVLF